ncbi:hypothetical protein [Dyadobacter sp. CY323]|uniref:hypothetical protein n=1 Tax=Dyadobacter sp. CY323 TaxID=2907302 RepID=UPI001F48D3F3|nr:hypothetical protein [Dyadobacter sp. CY323]MCE6987501.1 hypothetical protein [Dyadobacter sp. CY323]
MEAINLISTIVVVALSLFIIVLTLRAHVQIKKNNESILKTEFSTIGTDTTGRIVYRWLLILVGVSGVLYGPSAGDFILLLFAVITERLIIYRACRPDDRLGRFLTKYNW